MATVVINGIAPAGVDWDPTTCAGYPKANSFICAITQDETYVYGFPYEPVQVEFSKLSNEYVTIERPGNHPLISWKAPQLGEISFSFLVIDRTSGGTTSIEDDLSFLTRFASLQAPIRFSGATLLSTIIRHFGDTSKAPRAWRITDFSMTVRRKTVDGEASQAECSITLMEDRNPNISVVSLPAIVYTVTPPTKVKKPKKTTPTQPVPYDPKGWNEV